MKTPLTAVTTREDEAAGLPSKRRAAWPMVAFVAASGLVAWAVLHFSAAPPVAKQVEVAPPAPPAQTAAAKGTDEVGSTDAGTNISLRGADSWRDLPLPGDAVIVVDGTERGRGGATLRLWAGVHDVRLSGAQGEPHRAVEVRAAQTAHIKF